MPSSAVLVKVLSWQHRSSAPVPPQGKSGGSGRPEAPRRGAGPLGAQPLPQVLELAASKAADFTALDHVHVGRGTRSLERGDRR